MAFHEYSWGVLLAALVVSVGAFAYGARVQRGRSISPPFPVRGRPPWELAVTAAYGVVSLLGLTAVHLAMAGYLAEYGDLMMAFVALVVTLLAGLAGGALVIDGFRPVRRMSLASRVLLIGHLSGLLILAVLVTMQIGGSWFLVIDAVAGALGVELLWRSRRRIPELGI